MTSNPVVRWLLAAGGFVVGLATVLGTLAAFGVSAAELVDAIWPVGIVVLLSVALVVVSGAWFAHERRSKGVLPEDQRLLDGILHVLSRPRMRELQAHDFGVSWPEDLAYPATAFWHEFDDVEHRFVDRKLEHARADLYEAAGEFTDDEAMNGWTHKTRDDRRNVGWSSGEVEGLPEEYRIFEQRRRTILRSAQAFIAAHARFVEVAKQRGFDVSALTGEEDNLDG